MRKLVLILLLIIIPLTVLCAQNIVISTFDAEKIPSGDVLIFSKFFREEVQEQIDVLNKKIASENRELWNKSSLLEEIPEYKLLPDQLRFNEDPNQLLLAGKQVNAEFMITGEMSVVANSYIIYTELIKVNSGEVVRRNRRLVAGLGELTAASGLIAKALFESGDVILAEYVELQDDILTESERGDVRDTGEVLTDKGVAFKGVFSVVGGVPDIDDTIPKISKNRNLWKAAKIGSDALYTFSTVLGGMTQQFYIYSDIRFDNYYLSTNPAGLYEDYIYAKDWADGVFNGFFYSVWPSIGIYHTANIFGPAENYSPSGKLLMTLGTGLDMAGDLLFFFSAHYGIEARSRHFEVASGNTGSVQNSRDGFDSNRTIMDILYFSGIGVKAAGLTLRILGELKPPEGRQGFWNKALYLAGSAVTVAGTALGWMAFEDHRSVSQTYINYINSPVPSPDDYDRYEDFYSNEYLTEVLVVSGCLALGGILKGISYYIPGPVKKTRENSSDNSVSLEIGGDGKFLVARFAW